MCSFVCQFDIQQTTSLQLTFNLQVEPSAPSLPLLVLRLALVLPGGGARDPLEDQALVDQDDAGGGVVRQANALEEEMKKGVIIRRRFVYT